MHQILQDLKQVLPSYRPTYPCFRNSDEAQSVFDIGSFASKWPEARNSRLFENHLQRITNSHSLARSWFTQERNEPVKKSDVTFFIRTYLGDACWLPLLIESLDTFANEVKRIFCTDFNSETAVRGAISSKEMLVIQEQFCPGPIHQKYSKLTADQFCNTKYIIYLDSDTILCKPFDIADWFYKGKPCLEYTTLTEIENWFKEQALKGGNPSLWSKGVGKALGRSIQMEYSRRIEKVYAKDWLLQMRTHIETFHGIPFKDFMAKQKGQKSPNDDSAQLYFSDFNYMGAFLWFFKRNDVHWIDTTLMGFWCRPLCAAQFHSYSMTTNNNGDKKVTEVPRNFFEEVKQIWASPMAYEQAVGAVEESYQKLRARYRY